MNHSWQAQAQSVGLPRLYDRFAYRQFNGQRSRLIKAKTSTSSQKKAAHFARLHWTFDASPRGGRGRGLQSGEIFLFAARMMLIRLSKLCHLPPSFCCYAHPEQQRQINEFHFYFSPSSSPPSPFSSLRSFTDINKVESTQIPQSCKRFVSAPKG